MAIVISTVIKDISGYSLLFLRDVRINIPDNRAVMRKGVVSQDNTFNVFIIISFD
jgi:hypothetical protein